MKLFLVFEFSTWVLFSMAKAAALHQVENDRRLPRPGLPRDQDPAVCWQAAAQLFTHLPAFKRFIS